MDAQILALIERELKHQDRKWGANRTLPLHTWNTIIGEEYGEACRESLESDVNGYIDELADVAASAIAAIKSTMTAWESAKDYVRMVAEQPPNQSVAPQPLKRFWISWWTLPELMPKPEVVPFQFWETLANSASLSGVLVSSVETVIDAECDTQAWAAIGVYFKPSLPTTFEEKPMGWVPEGDRFVGFENRTAIKFDATA